MAHDSEPLLGEVGTAYCGTVLLRLGGSWHSSGASRLGSEAIGLEFLASSLQGRGAGVCIASFGV